MAPEENLKHYRKCSNNFATDCTRATWEMYTKNYAADFTCNLLSNQLDNFCEWYRITHRQEGKQTPNTLRVQIRALQVFQQQALNTTTVYFTDISCQK